MGILSLALALCLDLGGQDVERIQKLIQTLGDPSKDERDKAVDELARIGRPALEALQKATKSTDLEVKTLAGQAIAKIEWAGFEKLKKYVRENLDEGASVEPAKLKGVARWFPNTRFYEVAGNAAANGPAAMMGMQAPKSLFAVTQFEDGFHRILVKGIYCSASVKSLVQKGKIVLATEDAALDFALVFLELNASGATMNATAMMLGGGMSKLEKTDEGWALEARGFGTSAVFKTDKDGTLIDISQKQSTTNPWGLGGGGDDAPSPERQKLEIEKLRLEIDVLKRQLEKK